jgi:molybdopterin synthase sulfur carrier subunit
MAVTVRIPTPLRNVTNGERTVETNGASLKECLTNLDQRYPGIRGRLVDEGGDLKQYIIIYVNGEDVRFLQGVNTPVNNGDELSIVPAVAGGA